jgi:hypothetical protein
MSRAILGFLVAAVTAGALAAQSADSACAAPERRQFDFWLGSWTVHDTAGRVLGTSEVIRIARGCGLREQWRGVRGSEGMSLNVWQPAQEHWTQFWVGDGVTLQLTGRLEGDGRMVMAGDRAGPSGSVRDRIAWQALPQGEVRQTWHVSRDGGKTWNLVFDGIYRRAHGSSPL